MAHSSDSWRAGGTGRGAYVLIPQLATQKPLIVKGLAGQTANIFEVQNSSGSTLLAVDNSGNLTIAGSSNVTISESVTGNLSLIGNLSVTGTTALTGAVTLASTLLVGAASTFNTTALFKGGVTMNSSLSIAGSATFSSVNFFPDGSLTAPSISFSADTDSGLVRAASNTVDMVAGGQTMGRFVNAGGNTGGFRVGLSGTPSVPSISFMAAASTGMHHAGSNTLGIDANGTQVMTISSSSVNFLKGQIYKRTATAISYVVLSTDFIIAVTSTAAIRVITLPSAVTAGAGAVYIVKDETGTGAGGLLTNVIQINATAGKIDNISAAPQSVINTTFGSRSFYSNGTDWFNF